MSSDPVLRRTVASDLVGLACFIAICLAISGIGGAVSTISVGSWYRELQKPPFNPPDWVFAPVWTALYVMIAIAGWRVWRKVGLRVARTTFLVYAVQLVLNLTWSMLFFGFRMIGLALIDIVILFVAILAATLALWQRDRTAGILFAPYGAWVAFATVLNVALWRLN